MEGLSGAGERVMRLLALFCLGEFMAQYDGSIRIGTEITTREAKKELKSLESSITKAANEAASLRSKMEELKDVKLPTQEYGEIQNQIDATEKKINDLLARQEKFLATGGKESSPVYQKMQYDLDELRNSLPYLKGELQDLVDSGKAFTLGTDTEKYAQMKERVAQLNQQMQSDTQRQAELQSALAAEEQRLTQIRGNAVVSNQRIVEVLERRKQLLKEIADMEAAGVGVGYQQYDSAKQELAQLNGEIKDYNNGIGKAKENYKKLGGTAHKSLEKVNKSIKKSGGLLKTFASRLKGIALSLLIFNWITKAFNAVVKSIKEGFTNLYEGNEKFKSSVDSLKASAATLKNSLAAAFSPLVELAIPYIQRFVEWLTKAVNMIGQFIAALTGRKTYLKAIKQSAAASEEAAEATEDETDAMNKQLSPLDKLNNLTSQNEKENGKDSGVDSGAGQMFEEVPIDNKIFDFIQKLKDFLKPVIDYAQKLKDIFNQGFFDGLGDWEYRWDSIKDSIQSIKDSLKDIFTDPDVLAAADKWAQSVAYMLGSLVGSMASIGLTIATNLLGGIAKYLEQNKERIKGYLISMFDIWAEINQMFAELFQSIAYVFEAFASEQGQQLTANVIGIFTDAFMEITEIASKLFRDIAQIIIQPFVENKEAFRVALEGFLGVLAEVTGTIKQGIDDTFDKLNEVYDEHFKPFFDSVAQGLSDLVGQFLEFWNGNVQPILDQMATDFDELWTAHIQPMLDKGAELLGKVADLLKVLWGTILQPLISWIIENILPKILPIIQAVWNMVRDFAAFIADTVGNIITLLGGIIDFLVGVFTGDWERAFGGLQDIVNAHVEEFKAIVSAVLDFIKNLVNLFGETIKGTVDAMLSAIKSAVTTVLNYIQQNIVGKFTNIKSNFNSFKQSISTTWSNLWTSLYEKVKSILASIKEYIGSSFDWINSKVSAIKNGLSGFKNKVSGMFSGGASGSSTAYSTRSVPSPYAANPAIAALSNAEIPGYATGQVIPRTMKQHLAVLGDNNRETEVVSPLSTIEQAVVNAMAKVNGSIGNNGGGSVTIEIPVTISGIGEIGRAVQQFDMEFFKQNGRHAFT